MNELKRLVVRNPEDVDDHFVTVRAAADRTRKWLQAHTGTSMGLLGALKFEPIGRHPIGEGHDLNAIEQINQTFTYAVALSATRELLKRHPDVGGFILAPGAHMSEDLDIMSVAKDVVGAETFAAVHPTNNRKLANDLRKLASRPERYRYVFFASPAFDQTVRRPKLECDGTEVWSVAIDSLL